MKFGIAISDRLAAASLRLGAAIHILFLMSLVTAIVLVTGDTRADTPRCKGKDITAELAKNDPAKLAQVRAEAKKAPNGKGLLWKIEKNGSPPSYLFGTMHMTDPRVLELPAEAQAALDVSRRVAIETTDVLDQKTMTAAMLHRPDLMMFTDGSTLGEYLTPDDAKVVEEALKERGIPPASVQKMKPWMLISLVSLPACELARKSTGAPVLDVTLAAEAQSKGKVLLGLESVTEQLSAMASLPMELHIRGLVDTLKLGDRIDDVIETMIVLYKSGDTGMFWPLFHAAIPSQDGDESAYAKFDEAIVKARNRLMAERAVPIIEKGRAFIAVGALHLPGDEGLVELLRDAGYRVTAVE
ncbi:hypothetical protein L598_000200001070 [Mesorhizobium sp. J18]|uniref:TraB/GumN family protein n=1 Tax=Mesorhizobium sp. J18 TaxID=935263 RepID=UPI00119C2DEA|nr:TraB/GumN family protein [Mesorhizobium sp. J18]TWG97968.1 hypothetical protein L598_000200001070 [Mesorhizobium sp. J18]